MKFKQFIDPEREIEEDTLQEKYDEEKKRLRRDYGVVQKRCLDGDKSACEEAKKMKARLWDLRKRLI